MKLTRLLIALASTLPLAAVADPQYSITDLGVVIAGSYTQAFGISSNGSYVVGRNLTNNNNAGPYPAFVWSAGSGMTGQTAVTGHEFAWAYDVNNSGVAVGFAGVNYTGTGAIPMMWSGGTAMQMDTAGRGVGHVTAINNSGIAVGSVGGGTNEVAAIYNTTTGATTVISAVSANGSYMQTAYGINDAGLIVGAGVDASGRSVAVAYNSVTHVMSEVAVPAYAGSFNGSIASGISSNGVIVGSSGNSSQAFFWSAATGAVNVPLPASASSGGLNDVNAQGWAVGSAGGQYSMPFLYADGATYLIDSLITNGAGWNFSTTTSAAAQGISDGGVIVGTAQFNGIEHAYMLTPVPEPGTYALMAAGLVAVGFTARRRQFKAA